MSNEVIAWPKQAGRADAPPQNPIFRPCDASLGGAIYALETQLGTVEAYNRLAKAAALLKHKIDSGKAKPQNPIYATSIDGSGYKAAKEPS